MLVQPIVNAILDLPRLAVKFIIETLIYLAGLFARITGALLDWVTSPNFTSLPYTKPGNFPEGNPIIQNGLNITQSLVNLVLVAILVFIALSITLRLKDYASEKTLIRLIAIALLINFAPVFCGLIVDASNIATNYFLVGIKEGVSGTLTDISTDGLTGNITRPGSVNASISSLLGQGAIMIILNLSIGFAFFIFSFIFLFRYIAIWLLVILSPLAFAFWILPATKRLWDMWWEQLLNWSFIGIPMAFFLYLAMSTMADLKSYFLTKMPATGMEPAAAGLLDNVFPYFVITAMLYLGFVIGLKTAAMGASTAIGFAKKGTSKVTKAVGREARKEVERKFKIPEKAEQIGRRAAQIPVLRSLVGKPLIAYSRKRRKEQKEELEGLPLNTQASLKGITLDELIKGMSTENLQKQAHPGDLSLKTFLAMNFNQTIRINTHGSMRQKEALAKTMAENYQAITDEFDRLVNENRIQEAQELANKINYIDRNFPQNL